MIDEKIRLEIEKKSERDQGKSEVEIGKICKVRTRKKRQVLRISQNMIRENIKEVNKQEKWIDLHENI